MIRRRPRVLQLKLLSEVVDRESSKSRASTAERKRAYPQGDLRGKLYVYLWAPTPSTSTCACTRTGLCADRGRRYRRRSQRVAGDPGWRARSHLSWVHKTANVLDKLSQRVRPGAKRLLHEMYLAPTKKATRPASVYARIVR